MSSLTDFFNADGKLTDKAIGFITALTDILERHAVRAVQLQGSTSVTDEIIRNRDHIFVIGCLAQNADEIIAAMTSDQVDQSVKNRLNKVTLEMDGLSALECCENLRTDKSSRQKIIRTMERAFSVV